MLELHKKKNSLPPSAERDKIEREIVVIDEKIDEIVYELYGVTEEERERNSRQPLTQFSENFILTHEETLVRKVQGSDI
jgi:hypothetical protein